MKFNRNRTPLTSVEGSDNSHPSQNLHYRLTTLKAEAIQTSCTDLGVTVTFGGEV